MGASTSEILPDPDQMVKKITEPALLQAGFEGENPAADRDLRICGLQTCLFADRQYFIRRPVAFIFIPIDFQTLIRFCPRHGRWKGDIRHEDAAVGSQIPFQSTLQQGDLRGQVEFMQDVRRHDAIIRWLHQRVRLIAQQVRLHQGNLRIFRPCPRQHFFREVDSPDRATLLQESPCQVPGADAQFQHAHGWSDFGQPHDFVQYGFIAGEWECSVRHRCVVILCPAIKKFRAFGFAHSVCIAFLALDDMDQSVSQGTLAAFFPASAARIGSARSGSKSAVARSRPKQPAIIMSP